MGNKYSALVGIWKSVKNGLVMLLPVFVALGAKVPAEYAWIPGIIVYFIKNAIQYKLEN